MLEKVSNIILFCSHNIALSICIAIYVLIFIILAVMGSWECLQNWIKNVEPQNLRDLTKNHKIVYRLIEYLSIIYFPLLIPFWMLMVICKSIYWAIHDYAEKFIHNFIKICMLPIIAFNIIGEKFTQSNILKGIRIVEEKVVRHFKKISDRHSIVKKLKIYQKYTKDIASINNSFVKDYFEENSFKMLAGLLQIVSFFTTYAGTELFFGNLFDAAPLFITLVMQIGLYVTAIMSFRPGKKNFRKRFVMILLCAISITFSYVGLITLASPPEYDYQEVYQEYKTAFANTKDKISEKLSNNTDAAQKISKEMLKVRDTLKEIEKRLDDRIIERDTIEEPTRTNRETQTVRDENGQTITTVRNNTTEEWKEYEQNHNRIESEIISLENTKGALYLEIADAIGYEKTIPEDGDTETEDNNTGYSIDDEFYDKLSDFLSEESISSFLPGDNDDVAKEEESPEKLAQLDHIIRANNNALLNDLLNDIQDSKTIDYDVVSRHIEQIEKQRELNKILIPEFDDLAGDMLDNADAPSKTIKKMIVNAGNWIGADLNNSDMRELLHLRQKVQNEVVRSYQQLSSYFLLIEGDEALNQLAKCRNDVEEVPNIFFIAFERFIAGGTNRSNAIVCIVLAILNDGLTVLFGWAGSRKSYSFLYVKSSKDYYDDIDELFEVIFRSLTTGFYDSIRWGKLKSKDIESFTEECLAYVNEITQEIREFLDLFTLSECTCNMGYNLKYSYFESDDIKEYLPIISMLIKTNLMKVIPMEQYRHIELEYYCAINLPLWLREENGNKKVSEYDLELSETKKKGNVLLLRNKAENYLRENMYIDVEEK